MIQSLIGCSIILGLLVAGVGFFTMLAGRFWRIAARLKQDESALSRAGMTVLVGFVIFLGGFAMMFLPAYLSSREDQGEVKGKNNVPERLQTFMVTCPDGRLLEIGEYRSIKADPLFKEELTGNPVEKVGDGFYRLGDGTMVHERKSK